MSGLRAVDRFREFADARNSADPKLFAVIVGYGGIFALVRGGLVAARADFEQSNVMLERLRSRSDLAHQCTVFWLARFVDFLNLEEGRLPK